MTEPLLEGRREPMGAHVRDGGVNFAVFSQHAERIEICLFGPDGVQELKRHALHGPDNGVFHGFLPGASAGLVYGLRAHGPYIPQQGHRFNPNKLLLDPYTREIVGRFAWHAEHHGYTLGHAEGPFSFDTRDNAALALKARVAAPGGDAPGWLNAPRHSSADVVLYEVHVKGFSKTNPDIPAELRGTYAGLAHPAAIAHFKSLGVTTLSLLPVQYCVDEPGLHERGLVNYWGYNTLGFFCPDPRLAASSGDPGAVNEEFRKMVHTLHAHGLEVVLDVVYNHTPEGNEYGPTLSFRGLDNASWYRLAKDEPSRSENLTGCGNTLNAAHPRVTQFVLDSLRYWVREMGVDGFRFDLAPVLGRTGDGFDPHAAFFAELRQDPVLARVHLIAEPWDAGPEGYQLGRFPGGFLEWNDKFRDAVRGYWLPRDARNHNGHGVSHGVNRGELARRITASSELFQHDERSPTASVNFLSVHDGFTLADMVSYSRKHNDANGEDNRDGRDNELCANFGVEGPTNDAGITALRQRVRRAMMATLLLAQGTPMICAGDEIGNSQQGNNNAYCQDNPTGWLNWFAADHQFQRLVSELIALRRNEPLLRNDAWFMPPPGSDGGPSLTWFSPHGREMQESDWQDAGERALGCMLAPASSTQGDTKAQQRLMLLFNPDADAISFTLPAGNWSIALDSSGELTGQQTSLGPGLRRDDNVEMSSSSDSPGGLLPMPSRAVVVLRDMAP